MKTTLTAVILCWAHLAVPMAASERDDISADLAEIIAGTEVPSLAAAAVLDGTIVAAGASGVRKRDDPTPVTLADKYHIGSCTKSMTATLAAILVSEGKAKWQTTVGEVFDDLGVHEDYREATLHQLLSHTGGCPGEVPKLLWLSLWMAKGPPQAQRLRLVEGILRKAPNYKPGTGYEYSNAGVSVAGAMLERLADTSYEELMRDKVFKPLGMESAGFRAPATNGKIDQPYGHNPKPVDPEPRGDNPRAIAPAGAVHCSIVDLALYAGFHLGHGADEILNEKEIKLLHTPVSQKDGYALGWKITQRDWAKGVAITHAGSNTMFFTVIWIAPKREFAAVAACNIGTPVGRQKCDAAVAHLVKKYLK